MHVSCQFTSVVHYKMKVSAAASADKQLSTAHAQRSAAEIGSKKRGMLPSSLLHRCTLDWQQMLRQGSQLHAGMIGLEQSMFGL